MLDTSKLALGTVQFGLDYGISNSNGKASLIDVDSILCLAFERNIDLLDTANAYGESEQVIGKLNCNRFSIVTKFLPESQNGFFENQFHDSLCKLKTDNVYGLLAHRPMDVVNNPEIWKKMNAQKENQKVKKIGFSFDRPEEYYAVQKKSFFPDLVQVPFNYFDNRFIDIIKELKTNECEIHVRSIFLQGLFFVNTSQLPSFFYEVKELLAELQMKYDKSLAATLLNYVLDNHNIDKAVIGVQNKIELQNILDSLGNAPKISVLNKEINHKIVQPSLWPK